MLKELNLKEIIKVYDELMVRDFPACEIKPFAAIERMFLNGEYFAYGNYENEELIAYALISKTKEGNVGLLDYLAVNEGKRGSGYGSKTLKEIKEFFKDRWDGLIVEAEHIGYAKGEGDQEKRQRRISFYEKNGLVRLNFESRIYGTEYTVLYLNTKEDAFLDSKILEEEYRKIYQMMMPKEWNEQYVQVWKA